MAYTRKMAGKVPVLKQDLVFDATPTAGSENAVTSGGVAEAVGNVAESVGAISDVIPEGASADNKLVDQSTLDEATAAWSEGYTPKGPASVSTLNGLSGQENGDRYVLTDGGTLSAGSVVVVAGDEVAWDATNEVWYKVNQYALEQFGTNRIKDLTNTATDADINGSYFALDGISGPKKVLAVHDIKAINSISGLTLQNGVIDYDNTWWKTGAVSQVFKHVVIPVDGNRNVVTITGGEHDARIIGLKSYTPPVSNGAITDISDVWVRRIEIPSGKTYSFLIPSDVKYLAVNAYWDNVSCVGSIEFSNTKNGLLGFEHDRNSGLHRITVAAQNVRDFNTSSGGEGDGCPDDLVDTNLPLWKAQFSGFLNCDFLAMDEYYRYFDRSMTIDTYETLLKQFFPYKYMLPLQREGAWGTQMLLSKWPCVMMNLQLVAQVGFSLPVACVNMFGKKVAIVCWLQSVADTPETRMAAYSAAIAALADFDAVAVMGDFNTEVGMEELEVWTNAGYTLGNGGYWGEIKTWADRTPNDNIVTRGFIFEKFEVGEYVTSDHKAVRAVLSIEN